MKVNKFLPYSSSEIDTLMNEPWEVSDKPYMLHAAYALNALSDLFADEDEEEEQKPMWGATISQKTLDRLVMDLADDFNDSAKNGKPIKINGRSYSIRKVNAYDHPRLVKIFSFPLSDGEYTITKEGVLNLGEDASLDNKIPQLKESAKINRTFFRQVVKLAEDDANNGWDKLTDMEIVVYCWGLYYNKTQSDNLLPFMHDYKEHIYVTEKEIRNCFSEKAALRDWPVGMYTFSKEKVLEWNKKHNQKSYVSDIPEGESDDYWYDVALTKSFKPKS